MSAARVSVVLVSHESRDDLLEALRSIAAHASLPWEAIVVDNASTDGTAAAVRAAHPDARVVENAANAGFGAASNQGLALAAAEHVLFMNPDAALRPGALPALVRVLDERPRVALAGPRTRNEDGTPQVSFGADLTLRSEWRQRRLVAGVRARDPRWLRAAEQLTSAPAQPDWLSASCLLARRDVLLAVGGFDEGFFLYEEDADLCRRVRAAGWQTAFVPEAEVVHRLGTSTARSPERARREYDRSHLRYYCKHNGAAATLALRLLVALRSWRASLTARRTHNA